MDSDNDRYHFPKCQTHAYTRFENGCSENSTQKLLTKYSAEENNNHVMRRPRSVRIGKILGTVRYGTYSRPLHSFSQYGLPGRKITYMYFLETWLKNLTGLRLVI